MSGSDDWNRHVEQSRQRDLDYFKIHGRLESDPLPTGSASASSGGPGGLLALTAVAGVAASMLVMAPWIADQGTALEDGLRRWMPESWSSSPDGDGRLLYVGLAVGIPVVAALLVLFVLSMRLSVVSLAATFVVGMAFMVTLIVGGVVVFQAISWRQGTGSTRRSAPGGVVRSPGSSRLSPRSSERERSPSGPGGRERADIHDHSVHDQPSMGWR